MSTVVEEYSEMQIIEHNEETFMKYLAVVDPELWRIKKALLDTKVNPSFVPTFIRSVSNMAHSGGYGEIRVHMRAGIITHIKPEESFEISLPAILSSDQK